MINEKLYSRLRERENTSHSSRVHCGHRHPPQSAAPCPQLVATRPSSSRTWSGIHDFGAAMDPGSSPRWRTDYWQQLVQAAPILPAAQRWGGGSRAAADGGAERASARWRSRRVQM